MAIRYLSKADVRKLGSTVLLRLDFNTEDDWRMRATIPTIKFLLKGSCKIVIASHHGRPNGFDKKLSLRKDASVLSRLLGGKKIQFIDHFRFAEIKKQVAAAPAGSIFLLENLRFMPGEEKNDPTFAQQLASLADFYVNDAFAVSHRANASLVAITKFLPSYAGLELEKEIAFLGAATVRPKHPLVLIIGGAKAADKLGVMRHFRTKADWFLLGGGAANTFLELRGMDVKKSVKDEDAASLKELKKMAQDKNILLPGPEDDLQWSNQMIVGFGAKTIAAFAKKIASAKTIIWSGPPTLFEKKADAQGSVALAKAVVANRSAFKISGGGETVMFLRKYGFDKKFTFISTGGGAMLDFLAGEKLPGIEALKSAARTSK